MPTETEKQSNLSEIALHIGVSKDTIRNWIKNESMPAHKVGKLWLFRVSEVDQWIASQNQNHANTVHMVLAPINLTIAEIFGKK